MTLNEILLSVRDDLGETGEQMWKNMELVRWAHLAFNRHAREAYSVIAEVKTTSLPGVQEYNLPTDFGVPKDVRYHDDPLLGAVPLIYTDKQSIVTAYGTHQTVGTPYAFYTFQDKIGLYPVPNKPAVLSHKFSESCRTFVNILDADDEAFQCAFRLSIEPDPTSSSVSDDLDPCRVYVSHVSVYLRRKGLPYDGSITMRMRPMSDADDYALFSNPYPVHEVGIRPKWHHFDFTLSPIEINETITDWEMTLTADADYIAIDPVDKSGPGVQVGIDAEEIAWFQMHRHRNDIQIDYYRNTVRQITDYDEPLDLPFYPPTRYHDTIVDMTVEKALRKGQFDIPTANDYKRRTDADIKFARSQAKIKTKGDILRVPQHVRMRQNTGPYVDVVNGRFIGRAW